MARFGAILTNYGNAAITRAFLTGQMVNVTTFALGDAGGSYYQPTPDQTELRNEKWSTSVSHGEISGDLSTKVTFYATIPPELDGFTIREMCVKDDEGNMVAVCNTPEIEKVTFEEGVALDGLLAMEVEVVHAEAVKYQVNPYIAIATHQDIQRHNDSPNAHPDLRNQFGDYYTKTEADALLLNKANQADMTAALAGKADMAKPGAPVCHEHNLPVAAGIVAYGKTGYYINPLGEVTVIITIVSEAADGLGSLKIAQLPAGYRPPYDFNFPTTGTKKNGVRVASFGTVTTNGTITLNNGTADSTMHYAFAIIHFAAKFDN